MKRFQKSLLAAVYLTATGCAQMAFGGEIHKTPIEILKALPTESASAQDENPILGGTFIFKAANSTDLRSKFLAHTNQQTVNWHDLDKEAVTTLLSQMSTRYPLLFRAVERLKPISLYRVWTLKWSSADGRRDPYLVSGPDRIIFSDSFFKLSDKRHSLIHELAHLLDGSGEQSYSETWIRRMAPAMFRTKLLVQFLSLESYKEFTQSIESETGLPSIYAINNFKELLAEEVASKLKGMNEEHFLIFSNHWFGGLIQPTRAQRQRNAAFKESMILYKKNARREAIPFLMQAKTTSSSSLMANVYLAECYFNIGEPERCIEESNQALKKLSNLGLKEFDGLKLDVLTTKAKALLDSNQYALAKSTLNEALLREPANEYYLRSRAHCNFKLGLEAEGLLDLYRAKGLDNLLCNAIGCEGYDPELTIRLLDSAIEKKKSFESLCIRAATFQRLAIKSKNKLKTAKLIERAIEDLKMALNQSSLNAAEIQAQCGLLYLDRGSVNQAAMHLQQALELDQENIPAMIGEAKILELSGNTTESHRRYTNIRRKLEEMESKNITPLSTRGLHTLSKAEGLSIVHFERKPDDLEK